MYHLIKQEGAARRGRFETVHGTVQTPAFMNVATAGAIKGAVSAYDLKDLHCQVQLCNTYHLHLRPGDETVKKLGVHPPPVQGGGDAGHAPDCDAQPLFLQPSDGVHPGRFGRRAVRTVLPGTHRSFGKAHLIAKTFHDLLASFAGSCYNLTINSEVHR